MDIEAVRSLGEELQRVSGEIRVAAKRLGTRVAQVDWEGEDARAFKSDWWPKHQRALMQALDEVQGLGTSARNNADEQARVSSVRGGSSGGGIEGWKTVFVDPNSQVLTGGFVSPPRASDIWSKWMSPLHNTAGFFKGVKPIGKGLDAVAPIFGGVGNIFTGYEIGEALHNRDWMGVYMNSSNTVFDGLKDLGPMGYWSSVNLMQLNYIGEAATHIDWSPQGREAIFSASPGDWGRAIWEVKGDAFRKLADAWSPV